MVAIEKLYGGKEASADVPSVTEESTAGVEAAQFECGVDCELGRTGSLYGDQEPLQGHRHLCAGVVWVQGLPPLRIRWVV